jgi:hypothetical protein
MASRAHPIRQYSFGSAAPGAQREIWYRREDPVVLPRSRGWKLDYRLIAAAVVASALVTGVTYAAFYTAPPELSETASEPITREWLPDVDLARASASKALSEPATAVRSLGVSEASSEQEREGFFDDSGPANQESMPQQTTPQASLPSDPIPYPNPTTTPPDAIAPPQTQTPADGPAPMTTPDNPYR